MTLDEERTELIRYENQLKENVETQLHEWQLCPKCGGIGMMTVMYPGYVINQTAICNLCNGKMIISRVNGLPPNG